MRVVTDLPRPVRVIDHVWIPLSDGIRLGARIWLPEDAERRSGARRSSSTSRTARATARPRATSLATPYFAGHGYAVLRWTSAARASRAASSPTSTCPQEQQDALEVLALDRGAAVVHRRRRHVRHLVGRLQRPPGGRARAAGAEDRDQPLLDRRPLRRRRALPRRLGARARDALVGRVDAVVQRDPARPAVAGRGWRECGSSASTGRAVRAEWLRHQRRDDYWKQGSVCEDFSAIRCPVYAIGGWVGRLLRGRLPAGRGPRPALEGTARPVVARVPGRGGARARRSASSRSASAGGTGG